LASFYIRRSFRMLLAAIFFLSVVGLLSVAGLLNISMGRWLSTLFFAANYTGADHNWYVGHFWSLAVDEHFYFLWPAAFLLLRLSQRRMAWVIGLALLIALWRAVDFKFRITGVSEGGCVSTTPNKTHIWKRGQDARASRNDAMIFCDILC
jgi:peptidoglycan/LPS O-acetylase OafA/YrhL